MNSKQIRNEFLDFFKRKGHQIVDSAPLVVKNDPTLMFTNAGMNQFKDYFLGNKDPQNRRIADTQKCLRVSGKHNDLEEVGIDTYHHTMFEMLGNWSFGDYFKKEAIEWAWELLTEVYKLPKERLYVTVFGGDASENLQFDQEAYDLWKNHIDETRIIHGSKKDNFWEMGDTGPCGPCSEIHVDIRPQSEVDKIPGKDLVNQSDPLVIEIWNLVFIQYNRMTSGELEQLPAKHVDTGMGFERLCMAIQGTKSNYDTDVFQPMIQFVANEAGVKYGDNLQTDIALRVIVDHIRAISFAIADGQLPSNNKAGYVIRRILRRAIRYGYTFLKFDEPFLYRLVPVLANQFDSVFPELKSQQEFVARVIQQEEVAFLKTLDNGIKIFEEEYNKRKKVEQEPVISGEVAFKLYDTFGFPIDLTLLLARENGARVDQEVFIKLLEEQKERSRAAGTHETADWKILKEDEPVEFVGYDQLESFAEIIKYREVKSKNKSFFQVVLNKTPFYAESGGQVGDRGSISNQTEKIAIFDTKKENDLIIHYTEKLPSDPKAIFHCEVDIEKRRLTENNHTATHLLHAALRKVLGTHVQQKGSLVNEEVLRFDFSHFSKMTEEEIKEVEVIVNQKIRENILLDERRNVPINDAKNMGAMALFGEKYGDQVRVIVFDNKYSVELCGGTHVPATGKIGFLKILSESSVAAGVRRIEAVTANVAENYINAQLNLLEEVKVLLRNPNDLKKSLEQLLEEKNALSKEIENIQLKQVGQLKDELIKKIEDKNGIKVITGSVSVPNADALKKISYEIKNQVENLFLVLVADIENKPQIAVMISEHLVKERNLHAGNIVKELAKEIQGGGGGQPFFATAGGKDIAGLDKVLQKTKTMVEKLF